MKRFLTAVAFCCLLLAVLSLVLFPPAIAKENTLMALLNLPAPPPPNPAVPGAERERDAKFYDLHRPPPDDAPIEDLIDYWTRLSNGYRGALYYNPTPSDKTLERLTAEMAKRPALAGELLKILPDSPATVNTIRALYEQSLTEESTIRGDQQNELREWLKFNSAQFTDELERVGGSTRDNARGYVDLENENNLLALTKHDFDKARPILERMYADTSQPATRVLATWALYENAMATGALGDVERYRSELMRLVEDRTQTNGVRDKANDALTHGRDFPGRDEWQYSLFEDETLVNMPDYTMLTTLIMYSPPEKYVPKMIEIAEKTSNKTVRAAAVENLLVALNRGVNAEMERAIIAALLPWLEDPKWLPAAGNDPGGLSDSSRGAVIRKLAEIKMPESVPALIELLDEKERRVIDTNTNAAVNAAVNAASAAANAVANAANSVTTVRTDRFTRLGVTNTTSNSTRSRNGVEIESYPYRSAAVSALKKQADARAIPALRRLLPFDDSYERGNVVAALLASGGFTTAEQLAALDSAAKGVRQDLDDEEALAGGADPEDLYRGRYGSNANANAGPRPASAAEINQLLGQHVLQLETISDDLARGIVGRIEALDGKDAAMAQAYRRMALRWPNAVINRMLLSDVKRDKADSETVLRLLAQRKHLRETMSADVSDLRNGRPAGNGFAACIFEDTYAYDSLLAGSDAEAKAALFACARLMRIPLPLPAVAANLSSPNAMLATAAERYLESEDSAEARGIVLSRHPGEAKILGATSAFFVEGVPERYAGQLWELYRTIGNNSLYNGWVGSHNDNELTKREMSLREEVKKDDTLVGIYSYEDNFIRIHKDRVVFSWEEDESRYRERPLSKPEFDEITAYFADKRVDELTPFLMCGGEYCEARELVMVGRNGGRRVYMNGEPLEFFIWLDRYFAALKKAPATLKYAMSREVEGLEVLVATEELEALTVWKQGSDLRFAATQTSVRKAIEDELEKLREDHEDADLENYEARLAKMTALTEKRQWDGFGWHSLVSGEIASASQPPGVGYIPPQDAHAVKATHERWKTVAGQVEIRTSEEGLFKLSGGRLVNVRKGNYSDAVITPNGRWAVAHKSGGEDSGVVRVDLVTKREYPVELEGYGYWSAVAYVPAVNKVLLQLTEYSYHGEDEDLADGGSRESLVLLDAATGAIQPIAGEFRPLAQQTFRPLQSTARPNEFWAAMPDTAKRETVVGLLETKTFGFTPVLRIPKIAFRSMEMWVDEPGNKVYFVYRGHLLALPLRK